MRGERSVLVLFPDDGWGLRACIIICGRVALWNWCGESCSDRFLKEIAPVRDGQQLGAPLEGGGMGGAADEGESADGTSSTGSLVTVRGTGSDGRCDSAGPWQLSLLSGAGEPQERFFYRDSITWLEFAPALNAQLCDAFESGVEVAVVDAGDGRRYEVNFKHLTQKNVETGYVRSICWEDVGTGIRVGCDQSFEVRNRNAGTLGGTGHISILPRDAFHGMQLWTPNFDPFKKYGWPAGVNGTASSVSVVPWKRRPWQDPTVSLAGSLSQSALQAAPFVSKAKEFFGKLGDKVAVLDAGSEYNVIANIFQQGLLSRRWNGRHPRITAVHKISNSESKLAYFRGTMAEMEQARGEANLKYAWHGTSADAIVSIVMYGFGQRPMPVNGNAYGCGVYVAPCHRLDVSAGYAVMDENKEQHMLLCEVLLGQSEEIASGSYYQFLPSNLDYDTGTDNIRSPSLHVIWSPFINSHILPWYIVSFSNEAVVESSSSVGPVRKIRQATRSGPYICDPHPVFNPQVLKQLLCPPALRCSTTHNTQGTAALATAVSGGCVRAGMSQGLLPRISRQNSQSQPSQPQNSSPSTLEPALGTGSAANYSLAGSAKTCT